jgi:putative iron-dependent peroxidase
MEAIERLAQPGLFREGAAAGQSLEWALKGDAKQALTALAGLDPDGAVIGIGASLVTALDKNIPGLRPFPALVGPVGMLSTQHALWAYVTDQTPGGAFLQAENLEKQLGHAFALTESRPLFRYRNGRDLTGYKDGTGNPPAEDAAKGDPSRWSNAMGISVTGFSRFPKRFATTSSAAGYPMTRNSRKRPRLPT